MRVLRRALQAKGATVVVACPDKDTCAQTMTTLAAAFTPADGAWAVIVAAVARRPRERVMLDCNAMVRVRVLVTPGDADEARHVFAALNQDVR
jgi:hypothetical protein